MHIILDFLNFAAYLPFLKPDEEDISRNINMFKKQEWFKAYYNNEQYVQLITHNKEVRRMLGSFNTKKVVKDKYQSYYKKKIDRVLQKHLKTI